MTELVGAGSSGRTALAHAITAAVTSRGDFAACIDLPDAFDPEHARAAGIDLGHLLWVRPPDLRKALQATEHVLSTGGFSLVLVDLDDRHHRHPRVPAGAWMRLARAAAHTRCAILVIAVQASVGIFAAVRLETERRHATFLDSASPSSLFDGMISTVHLRKSRLGSPDGTVAVLAATAVA